MFALSYNNYLVENRPTGSILPFENEITRTEHKEAETHDQHGSGISLLHPVIGTIRSPELAAIINNILSVLPEQKFSNVKHGWGIKRNSGHVQPEVPAAIRETLARHNAYYVGNPNEKNVYLTFDEGYENGYTEEILNILKKNKVRAGFFITGHYLKTNPDLVKRMVKEGHIVGNHSENHPSFPDLATQEIKNELNAPSKQFYKLTGQKMIYLRPPKGEYSERTLAETRAMGYYNIFWSLALVDWVPVPGGAAEVHRTVMDNLHNGAVILLHAVCKENMQALDGILKEIKKQGYSFKTLDDLVKK